MVCHREVEGGVEVVDASEALELARDTQQIRVLYDALELEEAGA